MDAEVTNEPRVYGLASPNSYIKDLAAISMPGAGFDSRSARQRLDRYGLELVKEIEAGSPEGVKAERALRDNTRGLSEGKSHTEHIELYDEVIRSMSTGSGHGGEFVTPDYLTADYAIDPDLEPAFLNQTTLVPLPAYGLELYVPGFTLGASASTQAGENTPAYFPGTPQDPTATLYSAPVATFVATANSSIQLLERATGGILDLAFREQLKANLVAQLNHYVIGQAIVGAQQVTASGLVGAVAKANAAVYEAVQVRTTHAFLHTNLVASHLSTAETTYAGTVPLTNNKDIFPADQSGIMDTSVLAGFTGRVFPTGELFFRDDAAGDGTSKYIVARPATVVTATSTDMFRILPGGSTAGSLELAVQMYCYAAAIQRVPGSLAIVTGS